MEAASWLAGERWSDHPRSVHRTIASVARWVNDALDDEQRQTLWPVILASLETGERRGFRFNRRMRGLSRAAGVRAAASGRPLEAWVEVLEEFSRMTGHRAATVSPGRLTELAERLGASRTQKI